MSDRRRSPDTAYASDLPLEHVERIRRWHEQGLRATHAEAGINAQTFDYLGLTFYVPPHVQPIYGMSHLLGEVVPAEVRPGDRVLEDGCRLRGQWHSRHARRSRRACARCQPRGRAGGPGQRSSQRVTERLEVRLSDVFDAVDPVADGPYDLVVFDLPFR